MLGWLAWLCLRDDWLLMAYSVGTYVFVRDLPHILLKIVGAEYAWVGDTEEISFYKIKTESGVIKVKPENVVSKAGCFAERLAGIKR